MSYNPGIPTPTQNLSVSQGLLKDNFTVSNTVFGIDHYEFSDVTTNKGYHKDIHIVKRVGAPTFIADTGIPYVNDYTPDTTGGTAGTQLFFRNTGGSVQMTGTSQQADGWAWVGGILLQWGITTAVSTGSFSSGTATGTVTFKDRVAGAIPFPTSCFVVIPGTRNNSAPTGSRYVGVTILTKSSTNFTWSANGSSSAADGFFWMAIGN